MQRITSFFLGAAAGSFITAGILGVTIMPPIGVAAFFGG